LNKLKSIIFPLGQFQEGFLGIDSFVYSKSKKLWKYLDFPFPDKWSGVDFVDVVERAEHFIGKKMKNIPNVNGNLMFQYKRPEFVDSARAFEWAEWKQPYYRYSLYKKQQELLEYLDRNLSRKIYILYASPAISCLDDLVNVYKQNEIIINTNITQAINLSGHTKNTYISGGKISKGFSKSKEIEGVDLFELLSTLQKQKTIDFSENLINIAEMIENNLNQNEQYGVIFRKLNENIRKFDKFPIHYSLFRMRNFTTLFGVEWAVNIVVNHD
jgi:hypothetical protein